MLKQQPDGRWTGETQLGIPRDEGVIVAYLPAKPLFFDEYDCDSGVGLGHHGTLLDIVGPAPVKWWKVRNAARSYGLEQVEPIWYGPAAEFNVNCLPIGTKPDGKTLSLRQYGRGPWINLEEKDGQKS